MPIKLTTRETVKLAKARHYRVCAYCRNREYGENIGKTMMLAPQGKNHLSEAHFVHKVCPGEQANKMKAKG